MPFAHVLFAGAGGSTIGLKDAGFVTWGYEIDERAVKVHRKIAGWCSVSDLSRFDPDQYMMDADELWWASPPCQPFSTAGTRNANDERNGFPWLLGLLKAGAPRWLVIENVTGMLQHSKRAHRDDPSSCPACHFDTVIRDLRKSFRHVEYRVLDCSDYGVPQTRKRVITVCGPEPFRWPSPNGGKVSAREALGLTGDAVLRVGGPRARGGRGPSVTSIDNPAPTVRTHADIYLVAAGHTGKGVPRSIELPAPTVTTKGTMQFTDGKNLIRTLNVQERAKLQCMPYVKGLTGKMIGNAVPPPLAQAIGVSIMKHIKGEHQ